jgi:hypothetical protein
MHRLETGSAALRTDYCLTANRQLHDSVTRLAFAAFLDIIRS